jgi:uncharacterized lipoprotein
MKKLVLPALLALTLAACSSTGPENGAASVTGPRHRRRHRDRRQRLR